MREIPLTRGLVALVDAGDFDWLNQWKWTPSGAYVIRRAKGEQRPIYMHRVIMAPGEGLVVDHINKNGRDNRRANLRVCTARDNVACSLRKPSATGYRGVYFDGRRTSNPYRVQLTVRGQTINAGVFAKADEAARHYDALARTHNGEFAVLNFPERG